VAQSGRSYDRCVTSFYPDNPEGRELLFLHLEAFNRRRLMIWGRSVTNNRFGIIFSTIHLKTATDESAHGYVAPFDFAVPFSECRNAGIPFVYPNKRGKRFMLPNRQIN
jgi:hypothetical protein